MELYGTIWTLVESLGFLVVLIIFFLDPIRRWNFFGYRPTAVVGLFDMKLEKVLMVEVQEAGGEVLVWSFNQGGIYDVNIQSTTRDILSRELGLDETRFRLLFTEALGTVQIKDSLIIKRARLGTISLFPNLRGKGYMACYVKTDLSEIERAIQKGEGVREVRVVSLEEARHLILSTTGAEHSPKKQSLMLHMLDVMAGRMAETRLATETSTTREEGSVLPQEEK